MMEVVFWTGAAVWLLIVTAVVSVAAIVMQAVVRASIDTAAQLWRARGLEKQCTVWAAWWSSFLHGRWEQIYFRRRPVVRSGFRP